MATLVDIEIFEKRIEEEEKNIQRYRDAMLTLKELMNNMQQPAANKLPAMQTHNKEAPERAAVVFKNYAYNFTETIRTLIQNFDGKEFSVAKIEKALRQEVGDELPKNPRSRIAMVLKGFIKKGFVVCTYTAPGSTPYRYKEVIAKPVYRQPAANHNSSRTHHSHL